MTMKHRKKCSTSLVILEMLIKITNTKTHPLKWLNFKRPTIANISLDMDQVDLLHTAGENTKWYSPIGKQFVIF